MSLEYQKLLDKAKNEFNKPLEITEDALQKMLTYARLCSPYEMYAYSIHDTRVRDNIITDVYIPRQRATHTDVEIEASNDTEALEDILNNPFNKVVGWSHSHVDFGVFHSSVDVKNFKKVLFTIGNEEVFTERKEIKPSNLHFDINSGNGKISHMGFSFINSISSDIIPRVRKAIQYIRNNSDFMNLDDNMAKERYAYIAAILTNKSENEDYIKAMYYDVSLNTQFAYSLVVNIRGELLGKVIYSVYDEFNNEFVINPEEEVSVNIIRKDSVNLSDSSQYKILSYTPEELAEEVKEKVSFPVGHNISHNLKKIENEKLKRGGIFLG